MHWTLHWTIWKRPVSSEKALDIQLAQPWSEPNISDPILHLPYWSAQLKTIIELSRLSAKGFLKLKFS